MLTVAALFVETDGAYFNVEGVEPWDVIRDARKYDGPHPVVAHPPCERWGRYWSGGPSAKIRRELGDDGGCFASALASVRRFGGVLEHPEASHAWRAHGLIAPMRGGGWTPADSWVGRPDEGWTCCVEQGAYGHRARKATWLYVVGTDLPVLRWRSPHKHDRLDEGFHSAHERAVRRNEGQAPRSRLTEREKIDTPTAFRDVLIAIARSAYAKREAA